VDILWRNLIDEWRLSEHEIEYINRQQGLHCSDCQSNLRSMALAQAIMHLFEFPGLFQEFVRSEQSKHLKILEINRAGNLTPFLTTVPGHMLVEYPDVDIMRLPFAEGAFDLVIHSDTLEHIAHPIRALSECRRVLRPGGFCAFTIPMIIDRLTITRAGFPPSYHGNAATTSGDHLVHTEYGSDSWKQVILAGFRECRIFSINYPAAQAFVGVR